MPSNYDIFLKKTLGEDFMESLNKTELWKPGTKSVNDIEDMRIGLKIVPRAILSFLVRELTSMEIGEHKDVKIPVNGDAVLKVTKHERDQFSGEIIHNNKEAVNFKFRSIPGVGLVIMSAFELYDIEELDKPSNVGEDIEKRVQKMIDDRLALHELVERVVEKKMAQKDAVHNMMLMKLTEELQEQRKTAADIKKLRDMNENTTPQSEPYFRGMTNGLAVADAVANKSEPKFVDAPKKAINKSTDPGTSVPVLGGAFKSEKKQKPLAEFLEKRHKKEFSIQMTKGEEFSCPDCGKNIFDGKVFSGCICLGQDMGRKVFIKKSEDGVKVRFSRGWDPENIEMLLEVLQRKNK